MTKVSMVSALVRRSHVRQVERQVEPSLKPKREPCAPVLTIGVFNGGAFTFMRDVAGP